VTPSLVLLAAVSFAAPVPVPVEPDLFPPGVTLATLARRLQATDKAERLQAVRILLDAAARPLTLPDDFVRDLARLLNDPDFLVRDHVSYVFARLGPATVPHLLAALKKTDAPEMRQQALVALQVMAERGTRPTAALPALRQTLEDPDEKLRVAAVKALAGWLDKDRNAPGRDDALGPLLAALERERALHARDALHAALRRAGHIAVPELLRMLRHADPAVRRHGCLSAWYLLKGADGPDAARVVRQLERTLFDADPATADYAQGALQALGHLPPLPPGFKAAQSSEPRR